MRLLSLKVEPLGQSGWGSSVLEFGHRTTLIYAKNGSGKTPVIQSLVASLGFPLRFRDEILGKCSSVTLTAEHNDKSLVISRNFGSNNRSFHGVISFNGEKIEHFSESSFSKALFSSLGLDIPKLVSNKGEAVHPYISTVLPVFYLNQGDGYTSVYKSQPAFISDQFVEMIRFVFGLNPKHSFDIKKTLIDEKAALEGQTRKIVAAKRVLESQSFGVDERTDNQDVLQRRTVELTEQIERLRDSFDISSSSNTILTDIVRQKDAQISSNIIELSELQNRVSGIDTIRTEIAGEIETLGLNEEARRVFTSFQDVCGEPSCGLFLGSTESYGKNLLYLKDQIKDLDRNSNRAEMKIEFITNVVASLKSERQELIARLDSENNAGVDQLVAAVHALTKNLIETQLELGKIIALQSERFKLFDLEQERERIQARIDNLTNTNRTDHQFNKLRFQLRELVVKWMDVLETKNVSRNIEIDLDLRFKFDSESLDLFSGSTKIRLVLAIHAAIFEAYISEPSRPFRFMILDTPKQQELHTADLSKYLIELENLCEAKNAQLIISSTEYDHPTGLLDKRWLPLYRGVDHPMYFGKYTDFLDGEGVAEKT